MKYNKKIKMENGKNLYFDDNGMFTIGNELRNGKKVRVKNYK
jgi:hypothetical protein